MQVILSGDDFGLTPGINAGILAAHCNGLLTSASLVSGGPAAAEALALARANPSLDLGVHLTLCDETPVLPAGRVPSLVTPEGCFPSRHVLLARLLTGRLELAAAEREWRAQIETVLAAGRTVSHLDGHQHVHLLPGLWPLCRRLARDYRIGWVRADLREPPSGGTVGAKRRVQWWVVRSWLTTVVQPCVRVPATGFLHAGGRLRVAHLGRCLAHFHRRGVPAVEIMLHPGRGDAATRRRYPRWCYDWRADADLLQSRELRGLFARRGYRAAGFNELAGGG